MSLNESFEPMSAGKFKKPSDINKLVWPMIGQAKMDGIRCIMHDDLGPVTRTLKPIPNKALRTTLKYLQANVDLSTSLNNADGELCFGPPLNFDSSDEVPEELFKLTHSAVMSQEGTPEMTYYIYDYIEEGTRDLNYAVRQMANECQADMVNMYLRHTEPDLPCKLHIRTIPTSMITSASESLAFEEMIASRGYEGVILRSPERPYKCGRSAVSATQQHLVKIKRMEDAEGEIVEFHELMHNANEATKDAFGRSKRSSHKDGKIPAGTLGKVTVRILTGDFKGKFVKVGSGFTAAERQEIWDNQEHYLGKHIVYKYMPIGSIDLPRIPIYKSFRDPIDSGAK